MSSTPKLSNQCFHRGSISLCPVVKTQLMVLSLSQIRKVNLFSDEIFLTEICRILENLPAETRSFLVKAAEMQVVWRVVVIRWPQRGQTGDKLLLGLIFAICHNRMLGRLSTETIIQLNNVTCQYCCVMVIVDGPHYWWQFWFQNLEDYR